MTSPKNASQQVDRELTNAVRLASITAIATITLLTAAPGTAHGAQPLARTVSADTSLGCGDAEVTRTLASGSAWRMCARIHDYKGLVIESLQFRPATGTREYQGWMPVLDSLALAQLNVPYDTADSWFDDVTANGLGGQQLIAQDKTTCSGSTLMVDQAVTSGDWYAGRQIPGICVAEKTAGLAFHSMEDSTSGGERYTQNEQVLEISSISKVGWYEYQQKVTLTDQGTVTVGLGATGDIGQDTTYFPTDPSLGWQVGARTGENPNTSGGAASHWHNAIYRVDFGIDAGPQQVEQWDYHQPSPSSIRVEGTPTHKTQAFTAPPDTSRETWWRVVNPTSLNPDGHPRSYEIVNDSVQDSHQPATASKVSFTNSNPCQEYAWSNLNPTCPNQDIDHYVATDTAELTDPVAWINVGFHHIVRDEDQSPMPVHWQEFSLVPRDLMAQQATTPPERSCINGGPLQPGGSCAAINTAAPQITASPGGIRPGSLLSVSNGVWKIPRAMLSYQQIWLRDGRPIPAPGISAITSTVTGPTYTVTPADQGHKLSVQVLASAVGIIPGSALSGNVTVPAAATPPTTAPPRKSTPKLTASITIRGQQATVRVRVAGTKGIATGRVVVSGHGWKKSQALKKGQAVFKVRRSTLRKTSRVVVSYGGSARYLAKKKAFVVSHISHR
jgi:primary-amine oxidase